MLRLGQPSYIDEVQRANALDEFGETARGGRCARAWAITMLLQ
jgi:hypothetical protein